MRWYGSLRVFMPAIVRKEGECNNVYMARATTKVISRGHI